MDKPKVSRATRYYDNLHKVVPVLNVVALPLKPGDMDAIENLAISITHRKRREGDVNEDLNLDDSVLSSLIYHANERYIN